jgi:hypothetical protein
MSSSSSPPRAPPSSAHSDAEEKQPVGLISERRRSSHPQSSSALHSAIRAPSNQTPPAPGNIVTDAFGEGRVVLPTQLRYNPLLPQDKPDDELGEDELYAKRVALYTGEREDTLLRKWCIYIAWQRDIHFIFSDQERKRQKEAEFLADVIREEGLVKGQNHVVLKRMRIASYLDRDCDARKWVRASGLSLKQMSDIIVPMTMDQYLLRRLCYFLSTGELNRKRSYSCSPKHPDYDARENTDSARLKRLAQKVKAHDIISAFALGQMSGKNSIRGVVIPEFQQWDQQRGVLSNVESDEEDDRKAVLRWEPTSLFSIDHVKKRFHPRWFPMIQPSMQERVLLPIVRTEKGRQPGYSMSAQLSDGCWLHLNPPCPSFDNKQWTEAVAVAQGQRAQHLDFPAHGHEEEEEEQKEESDSKEERRPVRGSGHSQSRQKSRMLV